MDTTTDPASPTTRPQETVAANLEFDDVVVGAGIAGLLTSYYLASVGRRVLCIESHSEVCLEASKLNGGLICPSLTRPWSSPDSAKTVFGSFFRSADDAAVSVEWRTLADTRFWTWATRFLNALVPSNMESLFDASFTLSVYSKRCFENLLDDSLYRGGAAQGSLQLFPSAHHRDEYLEKVNTVPDLKVRFSFVHL